MAERLPALLDADAAIFTISVAAKLAGMHPQTLRTYDRLGLVSPRRSAGRGRRYSRRDVARLRLVQQLSQIDGVNLPGIQRILDLTEQLSDAERRVSELEERLLEAAAVSGRRSVFTADGAGHIRVRGQRSAARSPRALPMRGA